jgi:hypothetical protein
MKSLSWIVTGCAILALMAADPGAQEKLAAPGKAAEDQQDAAAAPAANESLVNTDPAGDDEVRAATARDQWLRSLLKSDDPDAEIRRMRQTFHRTDRDAADVALRYRQAQALAASKGLSSLEDPTCVQLKAELEKEVQAAFDVRQKIQRFELEQLRARLAQIEARVKLREQTQEEIVRQRVEALLHPERNWDPGDEARDPRSSTDPALGTDKARMSDPRDGSTSGPANVWTTDIAAAKVQAAKSGRLLLLYFRPKPSTSRLKQEAEIAGSTSVQKVLQHFVLVAIDTSDAANRELMEEYAIGERPQIVVTDVGGQPQYATEKDAFHDRWKMDTLLQDLTGHARRYQENQPAQAKDEPAAPDTVSRAPATNRRPALAQLPDGGKDPRSALVDAEWAVTAARSAVAAAEKSTALSRSGLKRIRQAHESGLITEKALFDAEREASDDEAKLEKVKLDLTHALRQVKLSRENLEAQKKLLSLDLADARLRVELLTEEESRARRIFDQKAMSKAEYDQTKLVLEQARLQLDRISELIKLYEKPLPGAERPDPDGEKRETPDSQEKKEGEGAAAKRK